MSSASPAIAPGGGTILFGRALAGHEDRFVTMSPDGTSERELDVHIESCIACAIGSPDGRFIAVPIETNAGVGTAVMDASGEGYEELPRPEGLNLAPRAWSPHGDRLAYDGWSDDDPSRIGAWTSAADGSDLKQIVASPDGLHYIPMAYSPDGRFLTLFRDGGTSVDMAHAGDLFVIDASGGEPRRLTPAGTVLLGFDGVGFNPASWAPDSRHVAFAALDVDSAADGRSATFVADVDTLDSLQISAWTRWVVYARWSPTGDWISFDAAPGGQRQISVVKPDGTGERTLATVGSACCLDWSPNGRLLVHQRGPERSSDLWLMDLDGHAVQVTHTAGTYVAVWWLP